MLQRASRFLSRRRRFRAGAGLLLAVLALVPATGAQAFAIYTSRAAWEAAVGAAITTDTFSNPVALAASITFDTGIVSSRPTLGVEPGNNLIGSGIYAGRSDPVGGNPITWDFPVPIFALGADWISTRTLGFLTMSGNFDGTGTETFDFSTYFTSAPGTGFLGIVGAGPFDSVVLGTESATLDEAFGADNLSFVSARVPAPATYLLVMLALAGLGFMRRRPQR